MLDLAIIAILFIGFFIGLKRGFILQVVHLTSFFISFFVAYLYYEKLAPKLILWIPYPQFSNHSSMKLFFNQMNLEEVYYRAIAFVIIFFAAKICLHIIGSMLDFLAYLPILKQLNVWAGGFFGVAEVYLLMFVILYISALLPIDMIQSPLNNSLMAKGIVEHTPILSQQIQNLWFK